MTRVKEFVAAFGVAVKNLGADNGSVAAAGVGFFSFLALVPAMVAAISIYGLWLNPADLENQIADLTESMPSDAASLVTRQLEGIATTKGLGPIAIVTVALALWSASGALKNLMTTLNTAYGRVERRKFFKLRGTALLLTIGAILAMVAATALIATLPSLLDTLDLSTSVRTVVRLARWVLLGFGMLVGLSVIYRFGPDRTGEDFEYITAGAVTAMLTWILVAFGFSYYADHYGTYGETFGAMAGLVMLLMWLYLTNLAVIFGAEVNAALAGRPAVDRRALVESGEDSDGHAVVGTEDGSI
ncbi:MAG: YihY/virulence factor BrkB family protein, partial [Actinobacteria bacterium]|nr:YihY/virulence factor BrkB family protein [Actinomycetota bacterium]